MIIRAVSIMLAIAAFTGGASAQEEWLKAAGAFDVRIQFSGVSADDLLGTPLPVAIDRGYVKTDTYTVRPNDTIWSILDGRGLQADTSSVQLIYELNDFAIDPLRLRPGQELSVIEVDEARLGDLGFGRIILNAENKISIDTNAIELFGERTQVNAWSSQNVALSEVAEAGRIFDQIAGNLGALRITDYALEPVTLEAADEALADIRELFRTFVAEERAPTPLELEILRTSSTELANMAYAAQTYDASRVRVEIQTVVPQPREILGGLSICYQPAIRPLPDAPGSCSTPFDTLSSPARKMLQFNLNYTIWAVRDGEVVSGFPKVNVRPNEPDGRLVYELPVRN